MKFSLISWYIFVQTYVETLHNLPEPCAVMQLHTMPEVTNLTERFKHFSSKASRISLQTRYRLFPQKLVQEIL